MKCSCIVCLDHGGLVSFREKELRPRCSELGTKDSLHGGVTRHNGLCDSFANQCTRAGLSPDLERGSRVPLQEMIGTNLLIVKCYHHLRNMQSCMSK